MILWHTDFFYTQHEFVISDAQKVGDRRLFLYHLNTFFHAGCLRILIFQFILNPSKVENPSFFWHQSFANTPGACEPCTDESPWTSALEPGNHWNERDELKWLWNTLAKKKSIYADFQGHHVFGIFSKFKRTTSLGLYFSKLCFCRHVRSFNEILSNAHSKKPFPPVAALLSKVSPLSTPWFRNVGLFQPRSWWRDD